MKYELVKDAINVEVKALIALCHIFDDYEKFRLNIKNYFWRDSNKKFNDLVDISLDKKGFFNNQTKEFYKYNKEVIDEINKYYYISNVLLDIMHYDKLNAMYEYFKRNKKNINDILAILEKLDDLGFKEIYFDENVKLDNKIYKLSLGYCSDDIYVVDGNVTVLPSRDLSSVTYKTKNANYLMVLEWSFDKISVYNRKIVLNSLVFDVNNLPNTISCQDVVQPLKDLKENNKETDQFVANSVYLDNSLNEMEELIIRIDKIVSKISEVDDKEKAEVLIGNTAKTAKELRNFLSSYEKKGRKKHSINSGLLEEEKQKYKTYLRDSAIDLC